MKNVTIKRNGMTVDCYGEWQEDSNCVIVGTWPDGEGLEEIWADGANNWTQAVEEITAWGKRVGCEIEELQAC